MDNVSIPFLFPPTDDGQQWTLPEIEPTSVYNPCSQQLLITAIDNVREWISLRLPSLFPPAVDGQQRTLKASEPTSVYDPCSQQMLITAMDDVRE